MNQIKKAINDNPAARWGILILLGIILSANYYFYDALSSLKATLQEHFDMTEKHYGLYVSLYSFPNTFLLMAVIGGIILDRIGIRKTGFLFILLMTLGSILAAYATSNYYQNGGAGYNFLNSFAPKYSAELKMLFLGRFFFGLGAETSIVVVSKILVKWFKGKDLALAFGLKVAFGRLGTFAVLYFSADIKELYGFSNAVWFAAILVCIGLLAFLIYIIFDLSIDRQLNERITKDIKKEKEVFKAKDIVSIITNPAYLMIAILCVTFYSAVFPFTSFAPDFFLNKFGLTEGESGKIAAFLPLGTMVFTPVFGFLIDKYGRSASVMIFGSALLLIVHLLFASSYISPRILMIILGIAFSLVPAAMWPSMVKLVKEKQIGTAYGLLYSIQNLGLWGTPLIVGAILDATNAGNPDALNYTPTMFMFAGLSLIGLLCAITLKVQDKRIGYGVDLPLNKK